VLLLLCFTKNDDHDPFIEFLNISKYTGRKLTLNLHIIKAVALIYTFRQNLTLQAFKGGWLEHYISC